MAGRSGPPSVVAGNSEAGPLRCADARDCGLLASLGPSASSTVLLLGRLLLRGNEYGAAVLRATEGHAEELDDATAQSVCVCV